MSAKQISQSLLHYQLLLTLFCLSDFSYAATVSDTCASRTEKTIINALQGKSVLTVDLVTALLVAEGIEDSAVTSAFKNKLNVIIAKLDKKITATDSNQKKSKIIFEYLHQNVFKKYTTNALLHEIFLIHEYNCVTATAIFYLVCQHYQIPVTLQKTPTHVYSSVDHLGKKITIELTDPKKGFDFRTNTKKLIDYLLEYKFITAQELAVQGPEAIYNAHVEETKRISPESLVDITYFNRALDFLDKEKLQLALCNLEKALFINPENESYKATYLVVLALAVPPQSDFSIYTSSIERAISIFKNNSKHQKALLPHVAQAVNHFDSQRNYEACAVFLNQIRESAENDSSISATINEYDRTIQFRWAASFFLRGEYEAAYIKLKKLHQRFQKDTQINDLLIASACKYAVSLMDQAKTQRALHLLDSLNTTFPEYPIVKEAYVEALLSTFNFSEVEKGNYSELHEVLIKAYAVAPASQRIIKMLGQLHHEMAMVQIRGNKATEAHRLIREGLKYEPTNALLQDDLKLVEELLNQKERFK